MKSMQQTFAPPIEFVSGSSQPAFLLVTWAKWLGGLGFNLWEYDSDERMRVRVRMAIRALKK